VPRDWVVSFSTDARIQRMRLTQPAKAEVNQIRRSLQSGPDAEPGTLELRDFPGIWRIRLEVGNRRMIYQVSAERRTIVIMEILRREEAYEKYPVPDVE